MNILLLLFITLCFIETPLAYAYSYDSTCICAAQSTNGYYCQSYTCQTREVVIKCFSGDSYVLTKNGIEKSLKNVSVGDDVLVVDEQNNLIYEPVYGFIHSEIDGYYDFLAVFVAIDKETMYTLKVSPNHLVFLYDKQQPVFAGNLKRGDQLMTVNSHQQIVAGEVIDIKLQHSQGFYAPLTRSGTIVVDGVVASNYATISNHRLAHLTMKPLYWYSKLVAQLKNSNDIHPYAKYLHTLAGIIDLWDNQMYDNTFHVTGFI